MSIFVFDCPFCKTNKMSGNITTATVIPLSVIEARNNSRPFAVVTAICEECWLPVSGEISHPDCIASRHHYDFSTKFNSAIKNNRSLTSENFIATVIRTPETNSNIPGHLSDVVLKAYNSAETNANLKDCEDAAATMYRRSIDIAIREKFPEIKGNLAPRIEKLVKKDALPHQMKDWADNIRFIGNDGAHEPEGVTKDELQVLRGFTDAFLRYLITLPFEVAFRRGEFDKNGNPIPPVEETGE